MKVYIFSHIYCSFMLIILKSTDELICAEFFLVTPRHGDSDYVYSPVNISATLHCTVNNTKLLWVVSTLTFGDEDTRAILHSRGVFQNTWTSVDNTTHSTLTVLGSNIVLNNNTRICCQTFVGLELRENCTTLIVYGRPSTPENVSIEYTGLPGLLNISWTVTTMIGVDQNYTIYFRSHKDKTRQLYYMYQLSMYATKCGEFLAFITAVNGAGESDPSNNVTIPSLPDIQPVTASLSHQVWKSTGGEFMVNVSFEPANSCLEYPLLNYLLVLTSDQTGIPINVFLNLNETEIILGVLENNQKYLYTLSAVNSFGRATAHQIENVILTSDVQSVTAAVVGESTIDIKCLFIHGSDAVGCKVILVSECSHVTDKHTNLPRSTRSAAFGQLSLGRNISCYHCVFAFVITVNNTISNLTIEGRIKPQPIGEGDNQLPVAVIVPILSLLTLVILVLAVSLIIMVFLNKRKCKVQGSRSENTSRTRRRWFKQTIEMTRYEVCRISTDGIEITPNEVYGVSTDGIESTPNEVYGVSTDGIETTPNEVYGVSTDDIETTPNEVYGVSTAAIQHSTEVLRNSTECQEYEHIN